ncbi:TBC1 domain family member 5 [Paragonimus westermani]|uniref:TBC1 domain family member 5 n=1 Tax=Paragonimus westermani TaxID=34504 RepID=A0A5J4NJF7_9TREM|nr:TBC1 domain family member 5 [Paragonimus westermani]
MQNCCHSNQESITGKPEMVEHERTEEEYTERGFDCLLGPTLAQLDEYLNKQTELTSPGNIDKEPWNGPPCDQSIWIESCSSEGLYEKEWARLLGPNYGNSFQTGYIPSSELQNRAFTGTLRACPFRSIYWRIYLGLLPLEIRQWDASLERYRKRFNEIDTQANRNPRFQNDGDHPLSGDQFSLWRSYFHARDSKRLIGQDVDRTFPTVGYFRDPKVRDAMVNVLYCYTEEYKFSYKQGMHEVLAPVFFVLHWDMKAFRKACEFNRISEGLQKQLANLFDEDYMEADVFTVFSQIMYPLQNWYSLDGTSHTHTRPNTISTLDVPRLFLPTQRFCFSPTPVITYLRDIHQNLLQKVNPKLYNHLEQLEIAPALFGVRWVRLLFGHEFSLSKLLYIWDCIFAVAENFAFVPCMYVAMLNHLSPQILNLAFSDCLSLLMRFPPDVDITRLIQNALHLYNPLVHPIPSDGMTKVRPNVKSKIANRGKGLFTTVGRTKSLRADEAEHLRRSHSAIRRKSILDFPSLNTSKSTSRSTLSLQLAAGFGRDIADGIRSAFSGVATPVQQSPQVIHSPKTSEKLLSPCSQICTQQQEKVDKLYTKCVEALETCSAHVDVALWQLTERGEASRQLVFDSLQDRHFEMLPQSPSGFIPQVDRLRLIRQELKRVHNLIDQIMLLTGYTVRLPIDSQQTLQQKTDPIKNESTPSANVERLGSIRYEEYEEQNLDGRQQQQQKQQEHDTVEQSDNPYRAPVATIQMKQLFRQREKP